MKYVSGDTKQGLFQCFLRFHNLRNFTMITGLHPFIAHLEYCSSLFVLQGASDIRSVIFINKMFKQVIHVDM